jgi:hypothetical protein
MIWKIVQGKPILSLDLDDLLTELNKKKDKE